MQDARLKGDVLEIVQRSLGSLLISFELLNNRLNRRLVAEGSYFSLINEQFRASVIGGDDLGEIVGRLRLLGQTTS